MNKTIFFHSCLGVFQGGGCRAAALVGAYDEAIKRGVQFAEVAGTSAGSIIAALIGAGATPDQLREFVNELNFKAFLKPPEKVALPNAISRLLTAPFGQYADLYYHQGFYSSAEIEQWVERCLRILLGDRQGPTPFSALPIPTSVVATDILSRQPCVWNQRRSPNDSVAKAVRASSSIPIFFQSVDRRYVDGGALSNLPTFVFTEGASGKPLTSRILAFVLNADDEQIPDWNTKAFFSAVANTVVEGSQKLQLELHNDVHVINISTGKVKATDFDKITAATISTLVASGRDATARFFDDELAHVKAPKMPSNVSFDREDLYGSITQHLDDAVDDIVISDFDTDFVYSLFPSLLLWRSRGARCRAVLPRSENKVAHGNYRRRLLRLLGVETVEVDSVPCRGFFVNCNQPSQGTAYIGVSSSSSAQKIEAVVYAGAIHASAIDALYRCVCSLLPPATLTLPIPSLVNDSQDNVLQLLKSVSQYGKVGVTLSFETVPLQNLASLTSHVREYKYRQIQHLIEYYRAKRLSLFQAGAVELGEGKRTIVTPPVVEHAGGKFVLVEGSTRATFLRDQGHDNMLCIVVRNLRDPLPSEPIDFSRVRIAGRSLDTDYRYEKLNYDLFRHIESKVHPLNSL